MNDYNDDVRKAVLFLTGRSDRKDGKRFLSYKLTPLEERECRAAIARLLISGRMPAGVLKIMAHQFAPDGPKSDDRKVVLANRKGGRPRDRSNDAEIVVQIMKKRQLPGITLEAAIAEVAEERGASPDTVDKAWRRSKDIAEMLSPEGRQKWAELLAWRFKNGSGS